ncbi:hypothetical protein GW17_00041647 [Ensete ventricosum]|nr:hypothetical protein GW17_00041647 [Ensete ventricosum]
MMRLNRIESFYAFLSYFYSKRCKEEEGRPAMTSHPGPGQLQPRPPCMGATARRGCSLQGVATCRGSNRQAGGRLRARRPQECRLWVEAPLVVARG